MKEKTFSNAMRDSYLLTAAVFAVLAYAACWRYPVSDAVLLIIVGLGAAAGAVLHVALFSVRR